MKPSSGSEVRWGFWKTTAFLIQRYRLSWYVCCLLTIYLSPCLECRCDVEGKQLSCVAGTIRTLFITFWNSHEIVTLITDFSTESSCTHSGRGLQLATGSCLAWSEVPASDARGSPRWQKLVCEHPSSLAFRWDNFEVKLQTQGQIVSWLPQGAETSCSQK